MCRLVPLLASALHRNSSCTIRGDHVSSLKVGATSQHFFWSCLA